MKKLPIVCAALLVAAAMAPGAWAGAAAPTNSETISLGQVFTGNTPDGNNPPWLQAEFAWTPGDSSGTLTLTSLLSGSDFVANTPNNGWVFYLDPNAKLTSTSCASGWCPSSIAMGSQKFSPVGGGFNLGFGWNPPPKSRFDGTDSAVIDLGFGIVLGDSSPFIANPDGWLSAAHIQNIGNNLKCSGFVVSGEGNLQGGTPCSGGTTPPPVGVPEPDELGLFGLGVLLIGGFVALRRRMA